MEDALSSARDFFLSLPFEAQRKSVLCAVSGGCDSVCLAHILCRLSGELGFSVAVGHVEHGIRGEDSLRDAEFAEKFARSLSVPFLYRHVSAPEYAKENSLSIETAARELRYRALDEMAEECGAGFIATAHHSGDQIETVLMHMLRGSGLKGLCGIAPYTSARIIRPLLKASKEALLSYARANSLEFMEDETNKDTSYRRNYLRHKVVPLLLEYEPSFSETVSRLTEALRRDESALEGFADEEIAKREFISERLAFLRLNGLNEKPEAIIARVLRAFVRDALGIVLEYDKTEELLAFLSSARGSVMNLPEARSAYLGRDRLYILMGRDNAEYRIEDKFAVLQRRPESGAYQAFPKRLLSGAVVRTRRNADFILPFGMKGRKSVSDLLTDKKLDLPLRDALYSVFIGDEALWIPSVCASEKLRVSEGSDDYVYLSPVGDFGDITK